MAVDERNVTGGPKRNGNQSPGAGRGFGSATTRTNPGSIAKKIGTPVRLDGLDTTAARNREIFEEVLDEEAFRDLVQTMLANAKAGNATAAVALMHAKIGRPVNRTEQTGGGNVGSAKTEEEIDKMMAQLREAGVDVQMIERAMWETAEDEVAGEGASSDDAAGGT